MLGLPKTTEFNKRIPKQKFYESLDVSPVLKKVFVDQVKTIYWRNKIATTTVNLAPGTDVTEIEVLEVKLNSQMLDERILRQMDREIPYHIIFVLEYQGEYQIWIGYKEAIQSGSNAFKVSGYYHTDWLPEEELSVKLEGLGMDNAYENFVRQIAGDALPSDSGQSLEEAVAIAERRDVIEKQIDKLKVSLKKEKQFNRQTVINKEIKDLKRQLLSLYDKEE